MKDTNFRIASALGSIFKQDVGSREMWLQNKCEEFDGLTPLELIKMGKGKIVAEYLEDWLLGMPT